jgi:ATP-binding cassette subfamily B protein
MGEMQRIGLFRATRWAFQYALRRWPETLAVLASMMLGVALSVLQPWPMKLLVDNVLNGKPLSPDAPHFLRASLGAMPREQLLIWSVAGTVVLFLLNWAVGLLGAYFGTGLGQRMVYDLAAQLFAHLQRLSLGFHSRKQLGDTIRRVTSDCSCVSTIVLGALVPVLTALLTLAAMFSVMWKMNPTLTLLSLTVVPFMVFVFRRYARPLLERGYAQQEAEGRLFNLIEQTLSSIPAIQAYTFEDENERRFQVCADDNLATLFASTKVQVQFKSLISLATALGTAGILWLGGREVLAGNLTVGEILVFLSYLASLYAPLNSLMFTSSTIQGAAASAQRVIEILETTHDVADKPNAKPLGDTRGHVRVENVTFGYNPGAPFLRGVSLEALPGETVAIVGPTGAGKSTLVGLVPRFFDPWEGNVKLDARDLREIPLKDLRNQIALVLQEPFLFPLTIAENIAYGRPSASFSEIESAARAANAHNFIERLPERYHTKIGERGATLSGGERQRLSIARALLKNAPILILDEPTSALDAETEALLLEALERLMKGRTTLIIAHRLSTIRNANRIAVVKDGQIIELGTHAELIAKAGLYARLYATQFGNAEVGEPTVT